MIPHAYAWRSAERRPTGGSAGLDDPAALLTRGVVDARTAGYDGIEASLAWVGGSDAQVAAALDVLGREESRLDALFVTVNAGIPDAALDKLVEQAVRAKPVGYRYLNVVTVPSPAERRGGPDTYDGDPGQVARLLSVLAGRLAGHDITVCWHPHDVSLRDNAAITQEVVEQAGDPVRLCLDLGWVVRAGEQPALLLRQFRDIAGTLHVRDVAPDGHWCEAVGEGCLDLQAISEAVQDQPRLGACAVELFSGPGTRVTRSPAENARRSASALRRERAWAAEHLG